MFTCETCREDIGSLLSQGRHHCRNCGGSFCAACSSKFIMVPYQLYLSKGVEQRVCDGCYNRIRDFHAQTQTTDVTWSGLAPPSNAAFAEAFALPPHETPVTIFNCSYFVDFAPHYGHLFMTRRHVCFQAYTGRAQVKIAFADLHALIKPEFYYINALQDQHEGAAREAFLRRVQRAPRSLFPSTRPAHPRVPGGPQARELAVGHARGARAAGDGAAPVVQDSRAPREQPAAPPPPPAVAVQGADVDAAAGPRDVHGRRDHGLRGRGRRRRRRGRKRLAVVGATT
ncbi:hypothetical protein PINS_up012745 [Pythium insidiosum]|nr:hypothetical protein PINS_up012745 [Pythium insidiosum]